MVVMYQIVTYIYIYIYRCVCIYIYISVYLPVMVNERMSLKQSTFYDVENSTPLVGLEPTISRLHTKFYWWSSCLRSSKQCISNIFLYIRGPKPRNCIWKWQKYELQMSDDSHFEFYDLWGNGAIYSLAYGRNGFSTKIHIETINERLFPKNAYRSLSRAVFQFFVLTNKVLI